MATTSLLSPAATAAAAASVTHQSLHISSKLPFPNLPFKTTAITNRRSTKLHVSSPTNQPAAAATSDTPSKPSSKNPKQETIFFDGGAHYGDLVANLLLGFTLLWLPLTLAAVSRAFFLRYRFTNLRVTVISGLTGQDRSDFSYKVIKDVQVVPRFIGEWGDVIITLKDGTKVDLRSVPRFREIAKYCLSMADKPVVLNETEPKGF
ncbi:Aldo/keto reductase [Corchorus olitorius]|uniref:Aldo/keto reductase n=1 Tax=Corchorus olitorius TaxID=93759 RepID=A0A1R3IIV0_9ROSI|nr:Aldo/keto reductase [Corchorus olitorius]